MDIVGIFVDCCYVYIVGILGCIGFFDKVYIVVDLYVRVGNVDVNICFECFGNWG